MPWGCGSACAISRRGRASGIRSNIGCSVTLPRTGDTVARKAGSLHLLAGLMEAGGRCQSSRSLLVPLQIEGNPAAERSLLANPVDRLLHLPMPTVPSLHDVGGRRQQLVVQERQRLLQVGRLELVQALAQ